MSRHAVLRRALVTTTALALSIGALSVSAHAEPIDPAPGVIHAWGYNQFGETQVPAALADKDVIAVSGGFLNSLALTSDGKITAWGYNEGGKSEVPGSLDGVQVVALAAGIRTSYALTAEGTIIAWGEMYVGNAKVPASLTGKQVTAIAADRNGMALTDDGHVTTWNYAGDELAVPSGITQETFTSIDTSEGSFFGVTTDGEVRAWGDNGNGQTEVPVALADEEVIEVVGSETSALALTADGHVVAWGDRSDWWDMHMPTGQAVIPAALDGKVVVDIAAGSQHSMALTADGQLHLWGQTYWVSDIPQGLVGTTAMEAGTSHSLVVATGTVEPFTTGPTAVITGTPGVDQPLGAAPTGSTDPVARVTSYRWFADDTEIAGARSATFTPTPDQYDAAITLEVTAHRLGYTPSVTTSAPTEPVAAGTITLPAPVVTGAPVVDQPLTVALPDTGSALSPADAQVTYSWQRGETVVGSGSTYSPSAEDTGHTLRVTATATRTGYDDASAHVDTAAVELAEFSTTPTPTISGTLKVGETLTASAGPVVPTPGQIDYQWYADGQAIEDATTAELVIGDDLVGAVLTVDVTAIRSGYVDASALSSDSAPVATDRAPAITLEGGSARLRRGQSTTLAWVMTEASEAQASGSWSGTKAASGTQDVSPRTLGPHTYVLTATNENGTTSTQVGVHVVRQAKTLTVARSTGLRLAGHRFAYRGRGLDSGEAYAIKLGTRTLAKGRASSTGTVSRTITIPAGTAQGRRVIRLVGSEPDRTGSTRVWILRADGLRVRLARQTVRASNSQTVRVTGLAPHERVRVSVEGNRVSGRHARANASGVYRVSFNVGMAWGDKTVRVVGAFEARRTVRVYQVVRR